METIRAVGKIGKPAQATVRAVPLQTGLKVTGSYFAKPPRPFKVSVTCKVEADCEESAKYMAMSEVADFCYAVEDRGLDMDSADNIQVSVEEAN
jgi:hypothetical protein